MQHIPFKDFSGGLDLRDQVFSDEISRFRLLNNFYCNTGKKLVRRPPLLLDGTIDVLTQGTIKLNGKLYAIAPKGTHPSTTGAVGALYSFLFFDNPDYCTTWTLVHARVLNGNVIAYIRHTFPCSTVPTRLFLHVFDGSTSKPTYVEDPYCPTNWGPTLPLHAYGQGLVGAYLDYQPFIGIGAQRAWAPRPDGNVQYSKLGNPRQWNTRALVDVENTGELYYFIIPSGPPPFNFIVSSVYTDLALDQRWSAYILEWLNPSGSWEKFTELASTPGGAPCYYPASITSRFAGQPNEIQLQVYPASPAGTIIRFRLIAGLPPVQIVSGCVLSPSSYVVNPNGIQYQFPVAINFEEFKANWQVLIDGTVQTPTAPSCYTVTETADGNSQINFAYDSITTDPAGIGSWITHIDFPVLAAGGIATIQVYTNGALLGNTHFTIGDNAGKAEISFVPPLSPGITVQAIYMPPANCVLEFATVGTVVTAGVISFEGNNYPIAAQSFNFTPNINVQLAIVYPGSGYPDTLSLSGPTQQVGGNGQQRYNTLSTYVITTDSLTPVTISKQTQYLYGSDKNQPSPWFNAKNVAYLINDVGVAEAGSINTSSYTSSGGTVLSISALQARMAFHFASATILFAVDSSQAGIAYLDAIPWGVTEGGAPQPVSYYDGALIMTPTGPRIIFLFGVNSQSMQDTNVGLPIERLGAMVQQSALFWPKLGLYLTAGMVNGAFVIECLSYSKEAGITTWSTWSCAGLSSVDPYTFWDIGGKLYLRSGTNIYHFESAPALCQDDNDPVGDPFESRAEMHYFAFGDASIQKKIMGVAFSMNGKVSLQQALLPYSSQRILDLCSAAGVTYGLTNIPLRSRGNGIATILSCTDPTMYPDDNGVLQPFILDQFGLDVEELRPLSRRG